jgi:hypothetical protein
MPRTAASRCPYRQTVEKQCINFQLSKIRVRWTSRGVSLRQTRCSREVLLFASLHAKRPRSGVGAGSPPAQMARARSGIPFAFDGRSLSSGRSLGEGGKGRAPGKPSVRPGRYRLPVQASPALRGVNLHLTLRTASSKRRRSPGALPNAPHGELFESGVRRTLPSRPAFQGSPL